MVGVPYVMLVCCALLDWQNINSAAYIQNPVDLFVDRSTFIYDFTCLTTHLRSFDLVICFAI